MSSSVRSWRVVVLDADPDFIKESLHPIAYEFANGRRKFRSPADLYSPMFVTADDGTTIITDDDGTTVVRPDP